MTSQCFPYVFSRLAEFCSETPRKFWKRWWPENVHIIGQQTYQGLKISINSIIEATQFRLWHRLNMYWQNAFENWFGWQISLGSRKDNLTMLLLTKKNASQSLMRVMLRNNVKLFCQFFVNFLIIIRARLWLLA